MKEILVEVVADEDVCLPHYASALAAGADVRAYLREAVTIESGESALLPTGLHVALPEGYEMQIRPRSGLAHKQKITLLNAPGTVDADFRGHVHVLLINHGKQPFVVEPGMRIAQLVFAPVVRAQFTRVEQLSETQRSGGGFGHTGLF